MKINLSMWLEVDDDTEALEAIQELTHHVEYLLDLDSWPEIKSVSGVQVKDEKTMNEENRDLYEIVCKEDSNLSGTIFAHCLTRERAERGLKAICEEFLEEVEIRKSNLQIDTVVTDGVVFDLRGED